MIYMDFKSRVVLVNKKTFFWLLLSVFLSLVTNSTLASEKSKFVTYRQFIMDLKEVVKELESSEVLQQEFTELQKTHHFVKNKANYSHFVIVRTVFEATRDSGLWQIRWAVTDREPRSDAIWTQWQSHLAPVFQDEKRAIATAVGECDELSALFAFIARSLGVKKVGLFWPTLNHVVAVWSVRDKEGKEVRVIVPTSQIFLSENATLGTTEFDAYQQTTIYDYVRKDVEPSFLIPSDLAKMMIEQVEKFGGKSALSLQARRNRLSQRIGGS